MLVKKFFTVVAVQILMLPLFSFLLTTSASAYPVLTEEDVQNARLQFEDPDFITLRVPDKDITIRFIDSDPWDQTYRFEAEDYGSDAGKITLPDGYSVVAGQQGEEVMFGDLDIDLYPTEQSTIAEDKGGGIRKSIFNAQNTRKIMNVNSNQPNQLIPTVRGRGDFTFSLVEEGYYKRDSEAGETCQDVAIVENNRVTVYELDQDGSPDAPDETQDTQCTVVGLNFVDRFFGGLTAGTLSRRINGATNWVRDDGSINPIRLPLGRTDLLSTPEASVPVADTGESGGGGIAQESCESKGSLSWLICPLIEAASEGIQLLDNEIRQAMNVGRDYYESEAIRDTWARFRNIASVLLIPILLVMVISTALGFQFVDAYTVKRAMPRLLAAVIFMSLSYDISRIMIEITNNIGAATGGLVAAPFGGESALALERIFSPVEGALVSYGAIGGSLAIGAVGFASIGIVASYLGVAFLALIVIFVLLNVRELIIVFLMVLAPLAILSWIFPGNDKAWKLWWNTFTKLLLIYPLVIGMLMLGRGMAAVVAGLEGDSATVFTTLMKLVFYIGPFFFIIAIFKYAGGVFANLAGMANNTSKGVFDRQKKYRADKRQQLRKDLYAGNRFKGDKAKRGWRKGINDLGKAGYTRAEAIKRNGLKEGLRGGAYDAADDKARLEHAKHALEDIQVNAELKNDDFAEALSLIIAGRSEEARDFLAGKGYSDQAVKQTIAQAQALERDHSGHALAQAVVTSMAASKTSFTGGFEEMAQKIMSMSHGNEAVAMKMLGEASAAAAAAGRHDLGGGSYGEKAAMLKSAMNGGAEVTYQDEEGNYRIAKASAAVKGADGKYQWDGMGASAAAVRGDDGRYVTQSGVSMQDVAMESINNRQNQKALDSITYGEVGRLHPTAAKNLKQGFDASMAALESQMANASSVEEQETIAAQMGALSASMDRLKTMAQQSGSAEVARIVSSADTGPAQAIAQADSEPAYEYNEYGNVKRDADGKPVMLAPKQGPASPGERVRAAMAKGYKSVSSSQMPNQNQTQEQLNQQNNAENES